MTRLITRLEVHRYAQSLTNCICARESQKNNHTRTMLFTLASLFRMDQIIQHGIAASKMRGSSKKEEIIEQ